MARRLALGLACVVLVLGDAAVANRAGAQERQPELKKLRVLLVIDTNAPRIGKVVLRDKEHMQQLLTEGIPPDRFTVDYLEKDNTMPDKIVDYYAKLQTGPDEALLFFYAGHGGMIKPDHYLTITADGLSPFTYGKERVYMMDRKNVVNALRLKKPGLAIVLSACCSTYLPMPMKFENVGAPPPITPKEINPLIRALFFQHRGVVDLTAAPPGDDAVGNDSRGTYFTNNLVKLALQTNVKAFPNTDGFVTWTAFSEKLKERMNVEARRDKKVLEDLIAKKDPRVANQDPDVMKYLDVQLAYSFQLGNAGKVARPKWRFGLYVDTYSGGKGVMIKNVLENTPASKAGLKKGDVLLSINGREILTNEDFNQAIDDSSDGKLKIEMRVAATGQTETREIMLEKVE